MGFLWSFEMSDLSCSLNMEPQEENMISKIIKTLEDKTRLVRDQTTILDVKADELAAVKSDLAETEVIWVKYRG